MHKPALPLESGGPLRPCRHVEPTLHSNLLISIKRNTHDAKVLDAFLDGARK